MWLSSKMRPAPATADADLGITTIAGDSVGVMTRGEVRTVPIYGPGGYVWMPESGAAVLVVKGGVGCQEQCVVAASTAGAAPEGLAPGELFLYSCGGASLYLREDGSIAVTGGGFAEGDWESEGNLTLAGEVELNGPVTINGTLRINGSLIVNGQPYRPCLCG